MMKREMINGVSAKIREMVTQINKVGVREIAIYYVEKKPNANFRRKLQIARSVAQNGYAETGRRFSVSRQYAEQVIKELYDVSLRIDGQEDI